MSGVPVRGSYFDDSVAASMAALERAINSPATADQTLKCFIRPIGDVLLAAKRNAAEFDALKRKVAELERRLERARGAA